jgi:hypothetical protein
MPVQERPESAEHGPQNNEDAATDDDWQKNREKGFAGRSRMGPTQADAVEHNAIDEGNEAAAHRDHGKQIRGTASETGHAKSRFKRPVRAAYQHQAKMQNGAAKK